MKKIFNMSACFMIILSSLFLFACGMSETEKNWPQQGAWVEIYVYKGEGDLLSIGWNEEQQEGDAVIQNTDANYTREYVKLYSNDENYKVADTNLPSFYKGNANAFETIDGKVWVLIMWTNTSTFLTVKFCN